MTQGIDPDTYFGKVLYTKHQAIETQVTRGRARCRRRLQPQPQRDDRAGPDQGRATARSSGPPPRCPTTPFAVSADSGKDSALVARLRSALEAGRRGAEDAVPICCRRTTPASSGPTTRSTSRSATPASPPASSRRAMNSSACTGRGRRCCALRGFAGALCASWWRRARASLCGRRAVARPQPVAKPAQDGQELARPSFVDLWFGNPRLEYRSDDGTRAARRKPARIAKRASCAALGRATWTTFRIATARLAARRAARLAARPADRAQPATPRPLAVAAKLVLDVARSIHTLVFGLLFVGIVGLGRDRGHSRHRRALAGHLRQALCRSHRERRTWNLRGRHRARRRTRLHAAVRHLAAGAAAVVSAHLYIWEYNIRDSTILGLIGAGGLGLLISEAMSLFQWGRLATILIAIVALVIGFDALSRRIRSDLMA